ELVEDIIERGVVVCGGGALLAGLDQLFAHETLMPVRIADDPLTCVVRGTGIVLEDIDTPNGVLTATRRAGALRYKGLRQEMPAGSEASRQPLGVVASG